MRPFAFASSPSRRPRHRAVSVSVSQRKQAARQEALRDVSRTLAAGAEGYLRATAPDIVRHISDGEWTASQVLEAYISRAALAQDLTNCLTEVLFAQARLEAEALDEEFAETGKVRGPLHGVPVSFKDQSECLTDDVKGVDSTIGFTARADHPRTEDAHVVSLVRAAGGIPITKTNVPQTMFFLECTNPVWGRSVNPHKSSYSPGGSSGGEGALLAMDGAALGWGSDIGGSLRVPATSCGVYSLKPGWGRVSMAGIQEPLRGFEGLRSVAGPMGRSVEDLELAARVVFGKQGTEYDPAPLPYRDVVLPERLRFGYYLSDGYVKASPANQRAVRETVDALRQAGHECTPFHIPKVVEAMECYLGLACSDGFRTLTEDLGDDPVEPGLSWILLAPRLPDWVRTVLAWASRRLLGDAVLARTILACRTCSMQEYTQLVKRRDAYARMFEREVWDEHGFDGLIAPVLAIPALPHDSCRYLAPLSASTCIYNLTHLPTGVLPVTRVDASDVATVEWTDGRVGDGHGSPWLEALLYGLRLPLVRVLANFARWGGGGGYCYYDPRKTAGVPVGVQVVGRRWEEEKVLEMMAVVDRALGPRDFGPFSTWRGAGRGRP